MEISSETTIPGIPSETTIPEISSKTTIPASDFQLMDPGFQDLAYGLATVLLQQYCCNSTFATVLLQQYCCNSIVATVLLQQYCCNSTNATVLLLRYLRTSILYLPCLPMSGMESVFSSFDKSKKKYYHYYNALCPW